MVARWVILDLVGGCLCDGQGFGTEGHLVDVTPVGAEGEIVGAIQLVDCGVYGVVGTSIRGGEAD